MESSVEKPNDRTKLFKDNTQGTLTGIVPDKVQFRVYNPKVLFTSPLRNFEGSRLTIRVGDQTAEAVFPRTFSIVEAEALLGSTLRYLKTRQVTDVYESPMDGIDDYEVHHYEIEVLAGLEQGWTITADIQSGDREFCVKDQKV